MPARFCPEPFLINRGEGFFMGPVAGLVAASISAWHRDYSTTSGLESWREATNVKERVARLIAT